MQSCYMDAAAFADLSVTLAREANDEALAKIHHEHLANGKVRLRKVYTGTQDRAIHEAMDRDAEMLRRAGAENFHRTKIGRNVSCPCGSGRKFKKCCIDKAEQVG